MSRRHHLHPPWIPGFWPLMMFLLLILSVGGYYYILGKGTVIERQTEKATAAK